MPARKQVKSGARTAAGVRRVRGRRAAARRRSVRRELDDVLSTQVESGEELRNAKVPIATEPASVFKA
jgi:hypothetical protein